MTRAELLQRISIDPGGRDRVKFKFDENLGRTAAAVLTEAGFDVVTVSDQHLEGRWTSAVGRATWASAALSG